MKKTAELHGHTALYRKHRPETFKDVSNQDHIISVLEGALEKDTVPHALLFTGSRGTGKTTVARIFARALGADDVDIYEIDAASNRGIDDIRELREAVHSQPYRSPYKVYIIDEVHMLTKEAFNALLKTLEEPPSHVVFILATTEVDKLLDTILSRCQVFNFRAPTRLELREHVQGIAKKEGCTLSTDAADLVAIAADGSYRDALGVLQKVMTASTDNTLEADEVAAIIGAPKSTVLLSLMKALHEGKLDDALTAINTAVEGQVSMTLLTDLLLERIRNVLLVRHQKSKADTLLGVYGEEEQAELQAYAEDVRSPINSHMLRRLLELRATPLRSALPQLPLELALLELLEPTE